MTEPPSPPLRIGIAGILGRMGRAVAEQVAADPNATLVGGIVRPGSGQTHPHVRIERSPAALLPEIDVLIDVSLPGVTAGLARSCIRHGTPLVCGVTGLNDATMEELRTASERVPVWYASNLSHGVNVLLRLLPALAAELKGYDVSIVERHHRHKRDAPSGTALSLARVIDPYGDVPIASVRAGGITGEHDISFTSDVEEITVGHRALSRAAFAAGAVRAAHAIHNAAPGWYGPE